MTIHPLKTWPEFFAQIADGTKTFELRINDRNFQVGDVLELQEYQPEKAEYTGRMIVALVTCVVLGGQFGLLPNFCVLGISLIDVPYDGRAYYVLRDGADAEELCIRKIPGEFDHPDDALRDMPDSEDVVLIGNVNFWIENLARWSRELRNEK